MTPAVPTPENIAALSHAKALLVLDHPFFAAILLRRPIEWANVGTACASPRGTIKIDPKFVASLDTQQLIFLLAHECMHVMLMHGLRRGARDPRRWNIAGDAVINDTLMEAKVGTMIKGGVNMPGSAARNTEDVYADIPEGQDDPGGTGMDIETGSEGEGEGTPMTEGERSEIEASIKVEMAQAVQAAKMQGKMPGGIARMVEGLLNVTTPWHAILERHMTGCIQDELSWNRPARRHIASSTYLPGRANTPRLNRVVIGVDTSGSIDEAMLRVFEAHMNRIVELCGASQLDVLYCDAALQGVDAYTAEDFPAKFRNPAGGGGTSFAPMFRWLDDECVSPDVFVLLTDMYGDQDSISAPDCPVVWLSTSEVSTAPFGTVVQFKVEH